MNNSLKWDSDTLHVSYLPIAGKDEESSCRFEVIPVFPVELESLETLQDMYSKFCASYSGWTPLLDAAFAKYINYTADKLGKSWIQSSFNIHSSTTEFIKWSTEKWGEINLTEEDLALFPHLSMVQPLEGDADNGTRLQKRFELLCELNFCVSAALPFMDLTRSTTGMDMVAWLSRSILISFYCKLLAFPCAF